MFDSNEIERLIEADLPCEFVLVESNDGTHFSGIVVSAAFERCSRIHQHQRIYAALGARMGNEIHALQLQTYTPAQWAGARGELGL